MKIKNKLFSVLALVFLFFLLVNYHLTFNQKMPVGANLYVPIKTLDRLGVKDLGIAMMKDNACKEQYRLAYVGPALEVDRYYTGRFGMMPVYERNRLVNKFYFCIHEGEKWEKAWEGKFNPDVAYMNFYCNKSDSKSKWQCIACGLCKKEQKEISELLAKY